MGEVRIGDRERELAMAALDEHHREGRIDPGEYRERSAVAATARVRSQLDGLFEDLPDPHPSYPPHTTTPRATPSSPTSATPAPSTPASSTPTPSTPPPPPPPGHGGAPDDGDAEPEPRRDRELPELEVPLGAVLGRNAGKLAAIVPIVVIVLEALIGFRFPLGFLLIPLALAGLGWLGHRYGD